jgi:hypothetical protein
LGAQATGLADLLKDRLANRKKKSEERDVKEKNQTAGAFLKEKDERDG